MEFGRPKPILENFENLKLVLDKPKWVLVQPNFSKKVTKMENFGRTKNSFGQSKMFFGSPREMQRTLTTIQCE